MSNFASQNRKTWSISVAVSTPPSHGGDSGSSPGSTTKGLLSVVLFFLSINTLQYNLPRYWDYKNWLDLSQIVIVFHNL